MSFSPDNNNNKKAAEANRKKINYVKCYSVVFTHVLHLNMNFDAQNVRIHIDELTMKQKGQTVSEWARAHENKN